MHTKLATEFPRDSVYRSDLAADLNNLGVLVRDRQELSQAEKIYREAIALWEKLVLESPNIIDYQINLAYGYHNLGNAVRDQGNLKAALPWYDKAAKLLNPIHPRPASATFALRSVSWDGAMAYGLLGRHSQAIRLWQTAFNLDTGPNRDHIRLFLAAEQMAERLQAQADPDGNLLFEAAGVYCRATVAAAVTREIGQQKHYGKRALELLNQAKIAGWFRDTQRIKQLKEDRQFDSLPRDDFKRFLESVEDGRGRNDRSGHH